MTPFTNREILESALQLNPDQPYVDWAAGYNLLPDSFDIDSDGDNLSNGIEMLINSSPVIANAPFTGSCFLAERWDSPSHHRRAATWTGMPRSPSI